MARSSAAADATASVDSLASATAQALHSELQNTKQVGTMVLSVGDGAALQFNGQRRDTDQGGAKVWVTIHGRQSTGRKQPSGMLQSAFQSIEQVGQPNRPRRGPEPTEIHQPAQRELQDAFRYTQECYLFSPFFMPTPCC